MSKRKVIKLGLIKRGDAELFLDVLKQNYGRNDIEFIYKENADGAYETIAIGGEEIDMGWKPYVKKLPPAALKTLYTDILVRADKLIKESKSKSRNKKPRKTSIKKRKVS
jgi:hypothetical protein